MNRFIVVISIDSSKTTHFEHKIRDKLFRTNFFFHRFCLGLHTTVVFRMQSFNVSSDQIDEFTQLGCCKNAACQHSGIRILYHQFISPKINIGIYCIKYVKLSAVKVSVLEQIPWAFFTSRVCVCNASGVHCFQWYYSHQAVPNANKHQRKYCYNRNMKAKCEGVLTTANYNVRKTRTPNLAFYLLTNTKSSEMFKKCVDTLTLRAHLHHASCVKRHTSLTQVWFTLVSTMTFTPSDIYTVIRQHDLRLGSRPPF